MGNGQNEAAQPRLPCDCFESKEKQDLLDDRVALHRPRRARSMSGHRAWADNDTGNVVALTNVSFGAGVLPRRRS